VDAWPIGIGAPCIGCTEKKVAFRVPMFQVIPIHDATPPATYAPIESPQGSLSVPAALVVGGVAGALLGAGFVASRKFSTVQGDERVPGSEPPDDPETPDKGPGARPKE
jgi:hydrogenase small subunit